VQGGIFGTSSYFLVNSIEDKWFTPELPFELEMDVPKTVPCTVADPESDL
jgi:hypothetical protein